MKFYLRTEPCKERHQLQCTLFTEHDRVKKDTNYNTHFSPCCNVPKKRHLNAMAPWPTAVSTSVAKANVLYNHMDRHPDKDAQQL